MDQMVNLGALAVRTVSFGELRYEIFRTSDGRIFRAGRLGTYAVAFPVGEDGGTSICGAPPIPLTEQVDVLNPEVLGIPSVQTGLATRVRTQGR
jgi:hypothetical protein